MVTDMNGTHNDATSWIMGYTGARSCYVHDIS